MSPNSIAPHIQEYTEILHDDIYSSWLAETFCKKYRLDCMYSPFTKSHIYTHLPCYLLEAASWNCLRCCLLGSSPHFAPIKLNSQPPHRVFFKVSNNSKKKKKKKPDSHDCPHGVYILKGFSLNYKIILWGGKSYYFNFGNWFKIQ